MQHATDERLTMTDRPGAFPRHSNRSVRHRITSTACSTRRATTLSGQAQVSAASRCRRVIRSCGAPLRAGRRNNRRSVRPSTTVLRASVSPNKQSAGLPTITSPFARFCVARNSGRPSDTSQPGNPRASLASDHEHRRPRRGPRDHPTTGSPAETPCAGRWSAPTTGACRCARRPTSISCTWSGPC